MDIQISGKHIDIGTALQTHVEEKLTAGVTKYYDRPVDAQVTFSKDGHEFKTDASVHLSTGMVLKTQGAANDIHASFDQALDRLEKRLRRYKRRLKDHHARANSTPVEIAPAYILSAGDEGEEEVPAEDDWQPVIVAESTEQVRTLSVGEAVMQMDLTEAPVIVFKNAKHGGINVVYRRADGHIGWVDPAGMAAS